MARKVIEYIKNVIWPNPRDGIVRLNWLIFLPTAPFLAIVLWHSGWVAWTTVGGVGLWGFTFSNAYLSRMYWEIVELQHENLGEMLNTIQLAYYALHEHCPNCGRRLKAPEEMRQ
jgi:hypothetical protein